jgi:hypothetical protein
MHKVDIEGKELHIRLAPLKDTFMLSARVLAALKLDNISELKGLFDGGATDLLKKDLSDILPSIVSNLASLLNDDKLLDALWKCAEQTTYNKIAITQDTFEPDEMRGYYLEIMGLVLLHNVKSLWPKSLIK